MYYSHLYPSLRIFFNLDSYSVLTFVYYLLFMNIHGKKSDRLSQEIES